MDNKLGKRLSAGLMAALVLSGCSSGAQTQSPAVVEQANKETKENKTPVTLKVYPHQPITEADFNLLIAEPVKKKYPYMTVQLMDRNAVTLDNVVASGQEMDLLIIWNGNINPNKELGIFEDFTPYAKKYNVDLSRFDPKAIDTLKQLSDKQELYGVPFNVQFNALYYNKDIFDRFGVPYPKDGMTWDDTVELTRKVSRTDGSVQYNGLDIDTLSRLTYPLSLVPVDAKTSKVLVNSPLYKRAFEVGKQLYSIPDNPAKISLTRFTKEKTLAMLASVNIFDQFDKEPALKWDLVQFPSYKELPNVYGMYDLHVIAMTTTSKHKEEAAKVIEVLLSDEVQMISSSTTGRVSPLTNPDVKKAFGTKMPSLQGKNVQSIFKSKPADAPPFSVYHSKGNEILKKAFLDYVTSDKKDVNTVLREAEEELGKYVESQQKK